MEKKSEIAEGETPSTNQFTKNEYATLKSLINLAAQKGIIEPYAFVAVGVIYHKIETQLK